jgi:hypothetical protein
MSPGAKVCDDCICKANLAGGSTKKPLKVKSRKHLSKKECAIGNFHEKYYLPSLEKLAYHRLHYQILGKRDAD